MKVGICFPFGNGLDATGDQQPLCPYELGAESAFWPPGGGR